MLSERQVYLLKNEKDKGNGFSESSLLNTLKSLNLPCSNDELNKIKDDLKSELDLFKQRELPESVFALLIDACYLFAARKLKANKMEKAVPMIHANIYEIQQIFQLRYLNQTQNS